MARALAVATAFGLAGAFRVDQQRQGQELEVDASKPAFCSISGDPHILTFDAQQKRGPKWHPMHAVGHYWLVKTDSEMISIQAHYGECGYKGGGGWMRKRLDGVPRTCMNGIAVGGRFMGGNSLVVQAPCDWDWENSKCRTPDKTPRITYNDKRVNSVSDGDISVTVNKHIVKIKLPKSVEIHLTMRAAKKRVPWQYMNTKIFMPKAGGDQCGHCGNFDGVAKNDFLYTQTGELKAAKGDGGLKGGMGDNLCDANVHCPERLIKGDPACNENEDSGTTFTIDDCPQAIRDRAEEECRERFAEDVDPKLAAMEPAEVSEEQMKDCVMDTCLDEGFADDDAKDAEEEDLADLKGLKGM